MCFRASVRSHPPVCLSLCENIVEIKYGYRLGNGLDSFSKILFAERPINNKLVSSISLSLFSNFFGE